MGIAMEFATNARTWPSMHGQEHGHGMTYPTRSQLNNLSRKACKNTRMHDMMPNPPRVIHRFHICVARVLSILSDVGGSFIFRAH